MARRTVPRLAWLALTLLLLPGVGLAAEVEHTPPKELVAGRAATLEFRLPDPEAAAYAILYVRTRGERKYRPITVRSIGADGLVRVEVPGERVQGTELQYFLRIVDRTGEHHDVYANKRRPVRVPVLPERQETATPELELGEALPELEGLDLSGLDALQAEFALLQAEDVVVSAAKHTQSIIEAPAAIYVLQRADLEGYGFRSLAEALRFVPGVQIVRVNEATPLVGVRGFADESNNLVLFLEQGRELNVELYGSPFLEAMALPLDGVERIEVIRGPGSTLYGANAFSGVVQVIPKRADSYPHSFRVAADEDVVWGGRRWQLRAAGVTEAADVAIFGTYREERSASDRGDRALRKLATQGLVNFSLGSLPLELSVGAAGLQGELFSILGETPIEMLQQHLALRTQTGAVRALLYWNHWDARQGIADPTLASRLPKVAWETDTVNGDLLAEFAFGEVDHLIVGVNGRFNRFASPQMVDPVSTEVRSGVFLQNEFRPWDHFILNVGLRSDYSTLYLPDRSLVERLTLSPRVSTIFPINDDHGVRLSYGTAFRKPSFFEQNARFSALVPTDENVANSGLENEQIVSYELGYTGRWRRFRWSVDAFFNQYRNFIELDLGRVRFSNKGRDSNSYGAEVALRYRIGEHVAGFANYSLLRIVVLRDNPLSGQTEEVVGNTDPEHMVNVGIRYTPPRGLQAGVAVHWQSARVWRIINPNNGSILFALSETQNIDPYLNVTGRLAWRFDEAEVGVTVEQAQADKHTEFPSLTDVEPPVGIAPESAGSRYGGEALVPRAYLYVEGRF